MPEFEVSWRIQLNADDHRAAARKALDMLRADETTATVFDVCNRERYEPLDLQRIDLGMITRPEDKRVLLYDGRYDGPDYSHPYWPTPGDPWTCVVCGTNTEGTDRRGGFDDRGSPHRKLDNGFYASILTIGPHAGESAMTCPKCSSVNNHQAIQPGPTGTGPGRTWRMGDPGGRAVTVCHACGHTA